MLKMIRGAKNFLPSLIVAVSLPSAIIHAWLYGNMTGSKINLFFAVFSYLAACAYYILFWEKKAI